MSLRVCTIHGCPNLTERPSGRCDQHERERRQTQDANRPSTTARGYGSKHQQERQRINRRMRQGELFLCPRCTLPILPGQAWDLDHTDNRAGYLGPSHRACNRATKASRDPKPGYDH